MALLTETEQLEFFKRFMEQRIGDMYDYVNACMKNDGDIEATSQRICILNAINELDANVTGTTAADLKIEGDD